jgi:hypothetical protein
MASSWSKLLKVHVYDLISLRVFTATDHLDQVSEQEGPSATAFKSAAEPRVPKATKNDVVHSSSDDDTQGNAPAEACVSVLLPYRYLP